MTENSNINGNGVHLPSPEPQIPQDILAISEKAADDPAVLAAMDRSISVTRDDYASGTVNWVFPAYGYNAFLGKSTVLPRNLPAYNRWNFYTRHDWTLLSTPHHESLWADAVATAVTKAAAWGWEVEGPVPLRRKRLQELYQYATAGVFMGWVPFLSAHLRSFLLMGFSVVEIIRERNSYSSKITGISHLNPLRCRFTDNPRYPVEYIDRQGRVHRLFYGDVMMFADQLNPTEGDFGLVESAAKRAYDRITTLEATHLYLYEKITGKRPLSIEFIMGVTEKRLNEMAASAGHDQDRKGSVIFKGSVLVPIPGDVPVQRVSIPIAELPDGFNYQEIHDNTAVLYASAIGMDVNDIDPRLAGKTSFGSGAQSIVLDQKARGKGLAAWRVDWTQQTHRLIAGTATTFAWSEDNLDDDAKQADISGKRADTRSKMIADGYLTTEEARNIAVDEGDLPKEYLQTEDRTSGGSADSDDNPNASPEKTADESGKRPLSEQPQPPAPSQQNEQTKESDLPITGLGAIKRDIDDLLTRTKAERYDQKKAREEAKRLLKTQEEEAKALARPMVTSERPLEVALGVSD